MTMQPLYVFDAEVSTFPGADPFPLVREHVGVWLSGPAGDGPAVEELTAPGGPRPLHGGRTVEWAVEGPPDATAVRVTVTQPLDGDVGRFVTRITVSSVAGRVGLRVVMGREVDGGWIAPVQDPMLRRPGLLRTVAADEALRLHVLGQRVTGRYERIRETAQTAVLAESLAGRTRLPILLMHPREDAAWTAARQAAGELIGLAQVVTLNYGTSRELCRLLPEAAVPDGGARLVWPLPALSHPAYARAEITEPATRFRWMRTLGELAVVARGSDRGWEAARRAARGTAARRAAERLAAARATGDVTRQLDVYEERVARLEADVAFWEGEAQALTTRLEAAGDADAARREAEYWRDLYVREVKRDDPKAGEPADPWEEVPGLDPADPAATYRALEEAADHRIVFTAGAERSWRSSGYPHPDEMTQQLITLAKAAVDLYDQPNGRPEKMPRITHWFKEQHGLTVATSDLTIKKDRKLRYFSYDGDDRRDGLPHVKVRDATSHNEVGRIHFAFDHDRRRLIVDHVGVKKY
ncbi:hypothetical protein ACSNOK_23110 [Streptomyces sp. URMC 126]|uniref:hypothetical protein n=1 Tax=Streptomyces sp. URMC 126 TaxID=3423401 RepID=UPI003F1C8F7B